VGGGIVTHPAEAPEEHAAGVLSGRHNRRPPVSNFARETCYGTIGARPIIIMACLGIGFGGR
jgi:hypothetical protein